ncbi:MAG TPA: hypothetical protein VK256_06985 [Candidatus Eisenbacteria bacterium]|nr:hypothetical protein [Candidatus Eisenbacteria bacterium]
MASEDPAVAASDEERDPNQQHMCRLREYACYAGFAGVEILPMENDFWSFYRLI